MVYMSFDHLYLYRFYLSIAYCMSAEIGVVTLVYMSFDKICMETNGQLVEIGTISLESSLAIAL